MEKLREQSREKAIALVNAYFDGKDIVMKDPEAGVDNWIAIEGMGYWSFLGEFCKNVDKYRIVE